MRMTENKEKYISDECGRIDEFLAKKTSSSRSQIKKAIVSGQVYLNEKLVKKAGMMIKPNDIIEVVYKEVIKEITKGDFSSAPYDLLYEDEDLMVINKHRGIVVHPSAGHSDDTLVNFLCANYDELKNFNSSDPTRPGIVHRIDKDTSGALIIAKNIKVLAQLQEMVKNHEVKREYLCIVKGRPIYSKFMVDANIGKSGSDRKNMSVVPYDQGKSAITHFQVVKAYKTSSLLKCRLETGRTHQIRVHLSSFNYPIIGDQTYGKSTDINEFSKGQLLHAYKISFKHPTSNKEMVIYAPIDDYFKESLKKLTLK